jgi:putative hydrolase of the HAD superfamily
MRDARLVFRALLLDLDDTLYDRDAAFARWCRGRVGVGEDVNLLDWLRVVDDRGRESRTVLANAIAVRLGVAVDPERFSYELAGYVEPEIGARDAIVRLARTRRVAIVARGGAEEEKLRAAGLEGAAHAVIVGEVGVPKPVTYARARRWSEVPPAACLVVGDDPKTDIASADVIGTDAAWRIRGAWPGTMPRPRYTLRSIAELEAIA